MADNARNAGRKKFNHWAEVKELYIQGIKLKELSETYNVPLSTMQVYASNHAWLAEKKKLEEQNSKKIRDISLQRIENRQSELIEKQFDNSTYFLDKAAKLLEVAIDDQDPKLLGAARNLYESMLARARQAVKLPDKDIHITQTNRNEIAKESQVIIQTIANRMSLEKSDIKQLLTDSKEVEMTDVEES